MKTLTIISKTAKRLNAGHLAYNLMRYLSMRPRIENMQSVDEAMDFLHSVHPDNGGSCVNDIEPNENRAKYDLDIIIPVYNAAQYVEECVDSVLAQNTRFSFHVTIVNDGSTDSSRDKLKKYENDLRITIIDQRNAGHSGARNSGLANVKGRYVMFVDSDDRLPGGAIDFLMSKAYEGDFDIVGGGFVRFDSRGIVDRHASETMTGFVWGKVYKAEMWHNIRFPEGYWFEDTINAFLFNNAGWQVDTIREVVYEWRRNTASISFSSKGKPKILDTVYVTLQLLKDRESLGLPHDDDFRRMLLHQFKVNAIRVYSLGDKRADYANFIICRHLYDKYNLGKAALGGYYKEVSKAFANNDYKRFLIACLFL